MDRERLFNKEGRRSDKKKGLALLVVTFYRALNKFREIVKKPHTMLDASEEHRRPFKEQYLGVFKRQTNLKDNLARNRLPSIINYLLEVLPITVASEISNFFGSPNALHKAVPSELIVVGKAALAFAFP